MSTSVTRLKTGAMAQVNETIGLNDTQSELERARFDHDAKMFALNQEFVERRDKLRREYHTKVGEITTAE